MINSRIRKAVKNSYPGADADSDQNPVVAKFKLSLKRVEKPKPIPKFAFSSQNTKEIREKLKEVMLKLTNTNINDYWRSLTSTIQEAPLNTLPKVEKEKPSAHRFSPELKDLLRKFKT